MADIVKKPRGSLISISKRPTPTFWHSVLVYVIAIVSAIIVSGIFIWSIGVNPFQYFYNVVTKCFDKPSAFRTLIHEVVPLLITSLGVAVAFKMKFWNIGAQGQFAMGAVGATFVALYMGNLPHWAMMILMAVFAMIFAGLWGFIPSFFKAKFGANETLLTLMLNYIAVYVVQFLRDGPWRDPISGYPKFPKLPKNAWIDQLWKIDVSWIVAIVLVIILFIFFKYTKRGYEISVVGDSPDTARYAGMNYASIVIKTGILSAAIVGIAGMLQVGGDASSRVLSTAIGDSYGFTSITVSWLAKLNPIAITVVSFLFAVLRNGCGAVESMFNINSSASDIIQGIILLIVIGFEFFNRYKIKFHFKKKGEDD